MPASRTTIEISKDYLHFNSAHFTIFSPTLREDLHGHTFYVSALITSEIDRTGLAFDYNVLKTSLKQICDSIDEKVLLPEQSPYLGLSEQDGYLVAEFAGEKMPFLPRDVCTLPVRNITVEELAPWIQARLHSDPKVAKLNLITTEIRVSSGPGQWAASRWASGSDAHATSEAAQTELEK